MIALKSFSYPVGFSSNRIIDSFLKNPKIKRGNKSMCTLRAGLVKNCRRCKSSVRLNCPYRKKNSKKNYVDTTRKNESSH